MAALKRYDIKKLLSNPDLRRRLIVDATVATQAREGIDITKAQAENSYYVVTEAERAAFFGLVPFRSEAGENDGRHVEFVRNLARPTDKVRNDVTITDFRVIEHSPLAFATLSLIGPIFSENPPFESAGEAWQGIISRDDEQYFRRHWEITPTRKGKPWITLHKGGGFCRFYFDSPLVVDWSSDAQAAFHRLRDTRIYFREGVTWPARTQRGFSVRHLPPGCVFSHKGPAFLPTEPSSTPFLLAVLNSALAEFMMMAITSFGSWEIGAVKRLPLPAATADERQSLSNASLFLHDTKSAWDTGNEICTRFDRPWVLQTTVNGAAVSLSAALDAVLAREAALDVELTEAYARLNDAVYRLYGINDAIRAKIEAAIGERPPEIVWPQMEGYDVDQKRREHVDRLLCYLVKRVVEADSDSIVCLQRVAQEPPLLDRVRQALATCFPGQDPSSLETEVVNELKKKTKGYYRAESLAEWFHDVFFGSHNALYQQRPLLWHLASSQARAEPGFACIVHAHRFNSDAVAKLRSVHVRDRLAALRREAAQAGQDRKDDERLDLLALVEEVEAFDAKLRLLQEGAHTGPEGGDQDFRILTPWKKLAERPQGWNPDLNDGIKINLAPLARTGVLRIKLRLGATDGDE